YRLKVPVWEYFGRYAEYAAVALLCYLVTDFICGYFTGGLESLWLIILIKAFICLTVPNILMLLIYYRFWEFKLLRKKAVFLLKRKSMRKKPESAAGLTEAEEIYLLLLKNAVTGQEIEYEDIKNANVDIWKKIVQIAEAQNQLPLIYDPLVRAKEVLAEAAAGGKEGCDIGGVEGSDAGDGEPGDAGSGQEADIPLTRELIDYVGRASRGYIKADYYLWHEIRLLQRALSKEGIRSAVMKGPGIARYYPIPELRKSGDIDLWLLDVFEGGNATDDNFGEIFDRARQIIGRFGYEKSEVQGNMHHMAFFKDKGPEVELHGRLTEIFDDDGANNRLLSFQNRAKERLIKIKTVTGKEFITLSEEDGGLYMLLHCLQHYTTKGFGWKFVCDWTAFLNSIEDMEILRSLKEMTEDFGIATFTEALTEVAVLKMGLNKDKGSIFITGRIKPEVSEGLLRELFDSGEFGLEDANRMVVLRSRGLIGLIREFHHQMRHNHPMESRKVWKWPYLWIVTLIEFIRNN
ncbi:MAG: nucleotidyltransferase family protein, partial [Lachnospiraceae bacterium]|nr:nucleotidyltransferase family protein [Lachnospiraceae bacterium]